MSQVNRIKEKTKQINFRLTPKLHSLVRRLANEHAAGNVSKYFEQIIEREVSLLKFMKKNT